MNYLAKLDKEKVDYIKKFDNYPLKLRFDLWVKHLSDETNFNDYFIPEENEVGLFKKVRCKKLTNYTLDLDRSNWVKFNKLCRSNKMSGNYALNLLVNDFVENGNIFTVSISI
tara:strand:- start:1872 stop:2210 length:339 start_codon:yes stop_codon:yes gene_type:complete